MKLGINCTTAEERRVSVKIATDVLLTMRVLDVRVNCYMLPTDKARNKFGTDNIPAGTPISCFKDCRVCAQGAMLISRARIYNSVALNSSARQTNGEVMGFGNTELIECAFECRPIFAHTWQSYNSPFVVAAVRFGNQYPDPRKRLRAIMKNVILNKGVFRP